MKIFIITILLLLLYYWIKEAIKSKAGDPKGKVKYHSPDEFQQPKSHVKDITSRSRIIDKKEKPVDNK